MTMRASLVIKTVDQASGPFARIAAGARRMGDSARSMATAGTAASRGMDKMRTAAGSLGARLQFAGIAALSFSGRLGMLAIERGAYGVGYAIGTVTRKLAIFAVNLAKVGIVATSAAATLSAINIIRVGAQFENFEAQLRTITGSSAAAKQSLAWVQDFAQTTPYELAEVTGAFIALKNRAIDPMDGTLRTLGDTAAALGTPLQQAVDMMADAMTFQFERLREYGITANQQGDKVTLNWVKNGKNMTRTVRKDAMTVRDTLNDIFKGLYGGSMEARSQTFDGIMSNLKDKWAGFLKMVADAGIFAKVKGALSGILDATERLAKNGQLQAWAKAISDQLSIMFDRAVAFIKETDWKLVAADITSVAGAVWEVALALRDAVGAARELARGVAGSGGVLAKDGPLGGIGWNKGFYYETPRWWKDQQKAGAAASGNSRPPNKAGSPAPVPAIPKGRGPVRPGVQLAPDGIWSRPPAGPLKVGANAAPRPVTSPIRPNATPRPVMAQIGANATPRPLSRQVRPVPAIVMANAAPPVSGKVAVDLTVNTAPGVQVRSTRIASSSPDIPLKVRTGRTMTGNA